MAKLINAYLENYIEVAESGTPQERTLASFEKRTDRSGADEHSYEEEEGEMEEGEEEEEVEEEEEEEEEEAGEPSRARYHRSSACG